MRAHEFRPSVQPPREEVRDLLAFDVGDREELTAAHQERGALTAANRARALGRLVVRRELQHGSAFDTRMRISVILNPLTGKKSCGHADTAPTMFMSAQNTTRSPGFVTGATSTSAPSGHVG